MRTDRTLLCARCALRMTRDARACPRCSGALHDLERASDRASALRLLERQSLLARGLRRVLPLAGARGPIDDAALSAFALEGGPGGAAQIEPGRATVAIEPGKPVHSAAIAPETRSFLADRLIDPDDASLVLVEAIVTEGDHVILRAASEREAAGTSEVGYRTGDRTRFVAGNATTPLHLAFG